MFKFLVLILLFNSQSKYLENTSWIFIDKNVS